MVRWKIHWLAFGVALLLFTTADGRQSLLQQWVHPGNAFIKANGYHGARTCSACHAQELEDVIHSVHWNLASPVQNVQGLPNGSWWGMANRQCALAGCTAGANWLAATGGKFTVQAAGCGVCHIGSLSAPPMPGKPVTQAQKNTVDCLVCHAKEYDWDERATLVKDASGVHWGEDTSLKSALSITRVPSSAACLRCHEHAFSDDYKRGTPFTAANDVHARAGIPCVTCHVTDHHKIAKGWYESDMVASDLPGVAVECARCHGESPHVGRNRELLNAHIEKLACETCHVTQVSGIVYEDWAKPVADDVHGRYSELSRYDRIPSIHGIYVPTVRIERGPPAYVWRISNTKGHADAQSWMAFATAKMDTPDAKIFPVRRLAQVMLFDRKLKMWQAPGWAFMKSDPRMAGFPLLLAPNRQVYNETGSVQAALAAGMKDMGVPWSGEWMAMRVPGPSYISVSHGIQRRGLACAACHSRRGVMDFKALGYPPGEIRELQSDAGERSSPRARR